MLIRPSESHSLAWMTPITVNYHQPAKHGRSLISKCHILLVEVTKSPREPSGCEECRFPITRFNERSLACSYNTHWGFAYFLPHTETMLSRFFYHTMHSLLEKPCLHSSFLSPNSKTLLAEGWSQNPPWGEGTCSLIFFLLTSPLSALKPRPMAPISECGRPADRLVNIHEKATSLMIPSCSERRRGWRMWPLTDHREK